jgi:restriction system protein
MRTPVNSVHICSLALSEAQLLEQLERLKADIEGWAKGHDIWLDTSFHTPFVFRRERPQPCQALFVISDGDLGRLLGWGVEAAADEYEQEFSQLLARHGFIYEIDTYGRASLYPEDEARQQEYLVFDRWRWVQDLASRRLFEIHTEVFEHFAARPEDLHRLTWRQYEQFLDAVFRNQGYLTEMGPGGNDGNVDLRLYQNAAVPELVAVVQAKRYAPDSPIQLDAVASLIGTAAMERASRGIFATTSRFLPSAKKYAAATELRVDLPTIELADLTRTQNWCEEIATHLNNYFSTGSGPEPLMLANQEAGPLVGRVIVASYGLGITMNDFAVIEAEFRHEIILRRIGKRKVSGDGQCGTEMPDQITPFRPAPRELLRFVAFKEHWESRNQAVFRGEGRVFHLWDGNPVRFDLLD